MQPFQELRFWLKRAPASERVTAAIAGVIVLGLLAWLVVPDRGASTDVASFDGGTATSVAPGTSGGGTGTGGEGTADTAPGVGPDAGGTSTGAGGDPGGLIATGGGTTGTAAGGAGATSGGSSGGAPSAGTGTLASAGGTGGSQGCQSPPGSTRGVTATEVRVAIALTEILGQAGNALFDVPTPAEARADFEAAIAGINKEGGIACRKIVPTYINVNPTDEAGMIEICRDLASSGMFAVIDTGSLATRPAALACLGQQKIPYFGAFYITETARRQFFPYLFSFYTKEQLYRSTALGLRDLGFFDPAKGFKKLGFVHRDCEREAIAAFRTYLREAGITDAQLVTYNVGCPSVFASEADLAQAVLTFRNQGVSHVTMGNMQGDIARFTANAEQQGWRPKYGIPDEAILSIASGSRAPHPANFANALGIALGREGENHTPGYAPTAGTQRCNAYRKAAGLRPVYEVPANAGHACDQLWMLQAALSNAPALSPTALVAGLQRAKSIDFSFPQGPNDFTGDRVTTGGQFWRPAQFKQSCTCWQLVRRDFARFA